MSVSFEEADQEIAASRPQGGEDPSLLRAESHAVISREARRLGGGELALHLWRCARLLSILLSSCENISSALNDERVTPMRTFLVQALTRCARLRLEMLSTMGPLLRQALKMLSNVALTFRESAAHASLLESLSDPPAWVSPATPPTQARRGGGPLASSASSEGAESVHSFRAGADELGAPPSSAQKEQPKRTVDDAAWEHGVAQLLGDYT